MKARWWWIYDDYVEVEPEAIQVTVRGIRDKRGHVLVTLDGLSGNQGETISFRLADLLAELSKSKWENAA